MTPSPTDVLREEHRIILRALALLETAAGRLADSGALPPGWWETLHGWLRAFADLNHHGKEEQHLFPALVEQGVPGDGGPVGVMLEEHTEGRALMAAMATGPASARAATARRYIALLRAHIEKENAVLLPLADAVLDPPAQQLVARGFEKVEAEQGPAAASDIAEAALDRLAAALTS